MAKQFEIEKVVITAVFFDEVEGVNMTIRWKWSEASQALTPDVPCDGDFKTFKGCIYWVRKDAVSYAVEHGGVALSEQDIQTWIVEEEGEDDAKI